MVEKKQVDISHFVKQIALVITINLLIKPIYIFGIDVGVFNTVGAEVYGQYWTLFNFVYVFSILSDLGLQQYNNRFISQSPHLITKYLPKILTFKLGLSLLFTIVVILFSLLFGYMQLYPILIVLIIINQILDSLFLYLRSNVAGLGKYTQDSLLSTVDKLAMIVILGSFLIWWKEYLTIYTFVIAQTISFIIANICAYAVLRNDLQNLISRSHRAFTFSLFRTSLPYGIIVFLMLIYMRIDVIMIDKLHFNGAMEVGKYAAEYRLLDAVNMVGYMIASLLLPMYARNLSLNKSIVSFAQTGLYLLMMIGGGLSILTFLYGQEVSDLFFDESSEGWGLILFILILTFIPRSIDYVFGTLLVASNKLKSMNYIYIAATFINIFLNFILIPKYGALGAAITTLFCQMGVATAMFLIADKLILKVGLQPIWGKVFLFAFLMIIVAFIIHIAQSNFPDIHIIVKAIILGFITLIIGYLSGMLRISHLKGLISNKFES